MTREELKKSMHDTKIKIVIKNLHKLLSLVEGYPEYEDCISYAIEKLEQEPKTGHWIKTPKAVMGEGYLWYCDKCEHQVYQDSSKNYPSEKYCSNCGAKMEGI